MAIRVKAAAEGTRDASDAARGSPVPGARLAWRFHALGEVGNFHALRRHLGRARADLLIHDVIDRLEGILPAVRLNVIGRTQVEMAWEGADPTLLEGALQRLAAAMDAPFDLDGETHVVKLVLGAAWGPAGADDVLLAEAAEQALAEARAADRAVIHDLVSVTAEEDRVAAELRRAIERDELELFYQPKIHVRRQEFTSAEALIRWRHPERGLVLPGDFIAVAERANLIDRLTVWTIARAIADQRRLRAAGHELRIFINISGQLLADEAFVGAACDLVLAGDATLGFEVTETSVIQEPERAIANLQRFADIGIRVAIDDYGAGLSSLAYLKQLPARELKIDKLFVTQLSSSNRDPLIVRSTIDLAHALDMEVVAEGVETPATLALLTVMGCDMVQGFLISRPITLDALIVFLRDDHEHRTSHLAPTSLHRLAAPWKRA
jgi:EAL domain-containing protein (putative c-di-GMP-specific phosphodiesterase class I)